MCPETGQIQIILTDINEYPMGQELFDENNLSHLHYKLAIHYSSRQNEIISSSLVASFFLCEDASCLF